MQKWQLLVLLLIIGTSLSAFVCSREPWQLTECVATITFDVGSTMAVTLKPDPTKPEPIEGCWIGGCHPANCSSWPQNLKTACATLWEKQRSLILALSDKQVKQVSFEGCASAPSPSTPLLKPLEWIGRNWTPRYFATCTTDPDAAVWLHRKYGPVAQAKLVDILRQSKVTATSLVTWLQGRMVPSDGHVIPSTGYQAIIDAYMSQYLKGTHVTP